MSLDYRTFPDAEAVANAWLRGHGVDRVYSSIPASPTYPLVVTKRIGGVPAEVHALDRARLQVEVWGNSKSEALDLAQAARVALLRLSGETVADPDAFVTCVEDDLGLQWLPDPETARDRYVFGMAVYLR